MTFVRLAFFPGATAAHYEALAAQMADVPIPKGRLLFAAGPVEGGWQVVQVWSSEVELADFNRQHLLPALASLGPAGFPHPPSVTDFHPVSLELPGQG